MDEISVFSLISSLLIILLFFLFTLFKRSQVKKLPPGPWKLPLVGNMIQLAGTLLHRGLRDLAKKHGPDLMYLQLGEIYAVVVSSPRAAKEVLKVHDLSFADRPQILFSDIILSDSKDIVFSVYGDFWRQMRKICTVELLTANKVLSFRSIREDEAWQLVESVQSSLDKPVNLSAKITALTNSVTCRAAIGERCKYQDAFIHLIDDMTSLGGGFDIADLFPSLRFLHLISGTGPKLEKMRRRLDDIFQNVIREHKEKRAIIKASGGVLKEEDLVDVLLRVQESGNLEFPFTSNDIQGIILNMLIAGTDTSSAAIEWAMSELIRNPKAMEKVQTEVRETINGKTTIHETDIQRLSYLKLVIKETLRLHPPVPLLLPRECREECEIDGYTIPHKTKVIVNAWAIGRDPEYWDDAESFKPERFENKLMDFNGTNFSYIPFGAGRRMCPGISFGVASVELPLALLLYHFNWNVTSGMKPGDLDMDESLGATLKRKNNLQLIPTSFIPSHE